MASKLEQPVPRSSELPPGLTPEQCLLLDGANFQTTINLDASVKSRASGKVEAGSHPKHFSHRILPLADMPEETIDTAMGTMGKYREGRDFIIFRQKNAPGKLFLASNTKATRDALNGAGYDAAAPISDPKKGDASLPPPEKVEFSRDFRDANPRFFQVHSEAMSKRRAEKIASGVSEKTQDVITPSGDSSNQASNAGDTARNPGSNDEFAASSGESVASVHSDSDDSLIESPVLPNESSSSALPPPPPADDVTDAEFRAVSPQPSEDQLASGLPAPEEAESNPVQDEPETDPASDDSERVRPESPNGLPAPDPQPDESTATEESARRDVRSLLEGTIEPDAPKPPPPEDEIIDAEYEVIPTQTSGLKDGRGLPAPDQVVGSESSSDSAQDAAEEVASPTGGTPLNLSLDEVPADVLTEETQPTEPDAADDDNTHAADTPTIDDVADDPERSVNVLPAASEVSESLHDTEGPIQHDETPASQDPTLTDPNTDPVQGPNELATQTEAGDGMGTSETPEGILVEEDSPPYGERTLQSGETPDDVVAELEQAGKTNPEAAATAAVLDAILPPETPITGIGGLKDEIRRKNDEIKLVRKSTDPNKRQQLQDLLQQKSALEIALQALRLSRSKFR